MLNLIIFLQEKHISLVHIESRRSKRRDSEVEIFVDCSSTKEDFNELIQLLRAQANIVSLNLLTSNWMEEEGTRHIFGLVFVIVKWAGEVSQSSRVLWRTWTMYLYLSELSSDFSGEIVQSFPLFNGKTNLYFQMLPNILTKKESIFKSFHIFNSRKSTHWPIWSFAIQWSNGQVHATSKHSLYSKHLRHK